MIIDMMKNEPHEVAELMCIKCYNRWIGVFPKRTFLREIECPECCVVGVVIKTGQTLEDEDDK